MMRINSFILSDEIINDMKVKINETKNEKVEKGFALCTDNNNRIIKGSDCIGTICSIKTGTCKENQVFIGDYHTHFRSPASMSIIDMVRGCDAELECIGSAKFDRIRCFTRKTSKTDCLNKISPFEEFERKNIIGKKEEIRKILRSPKAIIETGIKNVLKDIYQYERDIDKYYTNRIRLLKENFSQTDIS